MSEYDEARISYSLAPPLTSRLAKITQAEFIRELRRAHVHWLAKHFAVLRAIADRSALI